MFAPIVALALSSLVAINAAPITITQRANPPVGWLTKVLEPYDQYHTRYLAINCQDKHNTDFFDACCHPMLATESLEKNRKAYCAPSAVSSSSAAPSAVSSSSAAPKPTSSATDPVDDGEDCDDEDDGADDEDGEDCDDGEDDEPAPVTTSSKAPQTSATPKPTTTHAPSTSAKPTETPKPSTTKTSSSAKPTQTESSGDDSGDDSGLSEIFKGGQATFYEQNGVAGACGTVHSDNDLIVAMDYRFYGDTGKKSQFCGRKVSITNIANGQSVTATVADACPTCENKNSLDLSHAAFNAIGKPETGVLPIIWHFV